jgi:hypothetical protein
MSGVTHAVSLAQDSLDSSVRPPETCLDSTRIPVMEVSSWLRDLGLGDYAEAFQANSYRRRGASAADHRRPHRPRRHLDWAPPQAPGRHRRARRWKGPGCRGADCRGGAAGRGRTPPAHGPVLQSRGLDRARHALIATMLSSPLLGAIVRDGGHGKSPHPQESLSLVRPALRTKLAPTRYSTPLGGSRK